MLNIILSVLKVIGIFLLVIFLLFLFLVLIVLFGPISYCADGEYREKKQISAGVNWLGIVLRCKASYAEGKGLLWGIRLFGILIASNDEEFIRKKEEKRQKKAEKAASKTDVSKNGEQEEILAKEMDGLEEPVLEDKSVEESILQLEEKTEPDKDVTQEAVLQETVKKDKKKFFDSVKTTILSIKKKIKNLILKIKAIPEKIRNLITGIRAKIERLMEIKEFFLGERNREGFLHVINNLKKMLFYILPKKLRGKIEFGVEDPYTMGQILTVLGIFYPVYQDKFTVIPDFEKPGFAGEFSLKGRIIPGYLLIRLLIIICNREVRRIIKEGRELIGGNKS